MAELVVAPLLQALGRNIGSALSSALLEESSLLLNVNEDMELLQSILSTISIVIEDAERRSIRDDAPVRHWLTKLRSAAFDADHVVDEYQIEALRRRIPNLLLQVRDFFSPHNPIVFRHWMAREIKGVTKRLGEIAEERRNYHLAEGPAPESERLFNDRETHSHVIESDVFGRDEDSQNVINLLIDTHNDRDVSILPIVGLGGVGKTTLAQMVYNNNIIKSHFELYVWVCVSETFQEISIIRNTISCITKDECKLSNLQVMQEKLREKLSNRKFLLVLDDVWNEDQAKWERVKLLFRGGMHGSKILVTTRSDVVARIMGTVPPYQLKGLPADVCWTLFRQRAFGLGSEEETPRLTEIGKEIVTKCGSLPLAAKALGSLMSYKRGEAEWLAVKNSEIWKLPLEDTKDILPALRLSYEHLSSQLKQCFVYCSLFPKDYKLNKEKLIELWIAEGFIPLADDSEDIGNRCFNVLLWNSFFQDVEKDDIGNIVYCKMHDLVHDLACYVAGKETCTMEAGCERDVSVECRYVSVTFQDFQNRAIPNKCFQLKKLRTFLIMSSYRYSFDGMHMRWGKLSTHLRVLDLSKSWIEELPDNLDRLKHLRFLDLSYTGIRTLPASIISLQNLQTLNLAYCYALRRLPEGISFLTRLMHLHLSQIYYLTCMPYGMGRLNNLRTLTNFIVGKERGRTIVELQHLNLIRGDLEISDLRHVKDGNQAELANLAAKTGLQRLKLLCYDGVRYGNVITEDVLESLRPPNDLKELTIRGYAGTRFPSWMTSMDQSSLWLPNLVKVELVGLDSCEHLPPLGHLPFLKYLEINGVNAVRRIGREFYGDGGTFPSLQRLELWRMHMLEEWSIATESGMDSSIYPRLEFLRITGCPNLSRVQPCILSSVTELIIGYSNEELLSGRSLGGGGMPSKIKKLEISGFMASSVSGYWEGLQHLVKLEELTILWCSEMTCLPDGILHHQFPVLKSLTLQNNNQLVSLAGGGGGGDGQLHPPAFFLALQRLKINTCEALTALPEWLVNLTTLQELQILSCPLLETRYKRESGPDWNKIAHIRSVNIQETHGTLQQMDWGSETDGNSGSAFSSCCS